MREGEKGESLLSTPNARTESTTARRENSEIAAARLAPASFFRPCPPFARADRLSSSRSRRSRQHNNNNSNYSSAFTTVQYNGDCDTRHSTRRACRDLPQDILYTYVRIHDTYIRLHSHICTFVRSYTHTTNSSLSLSFAFARTSTSNGSPRSPRSTEPF